MDLSVRPWTNFITPGSELHLEGVQVGVIRALPVQANATQDTPFSASRSELRWRWAAGAEAITPLPHNTGRSERGHHHNTFS